VTDTTERAATTGRSGLATMNVVELKRLASGLGITGTTKMRKDDLVAAITARQVGSAPRSEAAAQPQSRSEAERAPEPVEASADPPERVEQRSDSATRERTSVAPDVPQDATQTTTDTTTDTTTRSERSGRTQQRPQQDRQAAQQIDARDHASLLHAKSLGKCRQARRHVQEWSPGAGGRNPVPIGGHCAGWGQARRH